MSRNQVERVDTWIKESLPKCKISKHEIETQLLRGPFKDALQNFLIPRYHSLEEIEVLRSNLYVHGFIAEPPASSSSDSFSSPEIERLTKELANWEQKKKTDCQTLSELFATTGMEEEDARRVNNGGALDMHSKKKKLKELHDMISFAEGLITNLTPLMETENAVILERENHNGAKIEELQEQAIQLFRSTFFESGSPEKLQELSKTLEMLCDHVVRGKGANKLSQKELLVWQKSEINKTKEVLRKLKEKAKGNIAEDIREDLDDINLGLTQDHLNAYSESEELENKLADTEVKRKQQQVEMMNQSALGNVNLSYILKMVYYEQLKAERNKSRQFKESSDSPPISHSERRTSRLEAPSDTIENLICGLVKNFPSTKSNLESVPQSKRYSEFIEALKVDSGRENPAQREHPGCTFDRNEKFEEMLYALNPNKESVSSSFAHEYNSTRNYSRMNPPLDNLLQRMTISDRTGRANLDAVDDLIELNIMS